MRVLNLGFCDTIEPIADFFIQTFSSNEHYRVIRNDKDPDYLIFGDENFGTRNVEYNDKNCIKIFFTGENRRARNYACHRAITFDHEDSEFHYRLPLHVLANYHQRKSGGPNAFNYRRNLRNFNPEAGFCSFVVKNGGCAERNEMFAKLSEYKDVAAGGPLFCNLPDGPIKQGEGGVVAKLAFLAGYKFNLCYENSSYPGYCTEKLFEALCGNTIPIYWGSPTAALDFNPRAYISWHDYLDTDLLIKKIQQLDEDEDEYLDMFLQPMWTDGEPPLTWSMERFLFWWNKNVWRGEINKR